MTTPREPPTCRAVLMAAASDARGRATIFEGLSVDKDMVSLQDGDTGLIQENQSICAPGSTCRAVYCQFLLGRTGAS